MVNFWGRAVGIAVETKYMAPGKAAAVSQFLAFITMQKEMSFLIIILFCFLHGFCFCFLLDVFKFIF